jgi:hypothetical protein
MIFHVKKLHEKLVPGSGLPDVLFSNQKSQFFVTLEGLGIENVGIFCDH